MAAARMVRRPRQPIRNSQAIAEARPGRHHAVFLAVAALLGPAAWRDAHAQITIDNRTATAVNKVGNVTTVTTTTVSGANAFNSFRTFGVDAGKTTNLVVPTGTSNLVNLVSDATVTIHGTLNSILQ